MAYYSSMEDIINKKNQIIGQINNTNDLATAKSIRDYYNGVTSLRVDQFERVYNELTGKEWEDDPYEFYRDIQLKLEKTNSVAFYRGPIVGRYLTNIYNALKEMEDMSVGLRKQRTNYIRAINIYNNNLEEIRQTARERVNTIETKQKYASGMGGKPNLMAKY